MAEGSEQQTAELSAYLAELDEIPEDDPFDLQDPSIDAPEAICWNSKSPSYTGQSVHSPTLNWAICCRKGLVDSGETFERNLT